jgi:SpoIID/LytB domain protein
MSQYGARGRANAGKTYDEILAFYYQGTSLGKVNADKGSLCPEELRPCIRVLLAERFKPTSDQLARVIARSGGWQSEVFPDQVFPSDSYVQVDPVGGGWTATAYAAGGTVLAGPARVDGKFTVAPAEPDTLLEMHFRYSQARRYFLYRGQMRVFVDSTGVTVVNKVNLEDYLRGVVPAEVPATWPIEAVKAQAVAARGYAYASISSSGRYDVRPTAADQMYGGVMAEYPLPCDGSGCHATLNINAGGNRAVAETAGRIVLRANGNLARTYFFATGGGATENIEYAWPARDGTPSSPVAYLKGRIDTDKNGVAFDIRASNPDKILSASYYAWQSGKFTIGQLNRVIASKAAMAPAGKISAFSQIKFDYGVSRVYRVTIKGDRKTVTVSGIVFKNAYNKAADAGIVSGGKLHSTNYRLKIVP